MEMPVDILTHRFGKLRDSGILDADHTALALDIDEELQRKFVMIPYEEIENVVIETLSDNADDPTLQAGSGPEAIRANTADNPNWLYNSAVHALAMWQHLSRLQEKKAEEERLAKRPEPGVYQGFSGHNYFTVIVPEDRRVLIQNVSGGLSDNTDVWDATLNGPWSLQRVDITDGTISA